MSSNDAFSSPYSTVFQALVDLHSFAACMLSHLLRHPDVSPSVLSSRRSSLLPARAGTGLDVLRTPSQPGHEGSTHARHSCRCAVRVLSRCRLRKVSLWADSPSWFLFWPFFASPLLVTASSCLLGQGPACISSSPPQTVMLLRDQQPSPSAPNACLSSVRFSLAYPSHHSRSAKPTGLHGGWLPWPPLSASLPL